MKTRFPLFIIGAVLAALTTPAVAQQQQRYDANGQPLQRQQVRPVQTKQPQARRPQVQQPVEQAEAPVVAAAAPAAQQPQGAAPAQNFIVPQAPAPTIINNPPAATPAKPSGGIINIGQSLNETAGPIVNDVVNFLILTLMGLAAAWWKQKTGTDVDKNLRDGVTRGLQNQAGTLLAAGAVKLDGLKLNVNNAELANAANNLLAGFPDAAKNFGLTPEWAKEKILATLPQTEAGAAIIAAAHAAAPPEEKKP